MKGGLYKMAVVISVSIDKEQKQYLEELGVSPSGLLQRSINELIENHKVSNDFVNKLQSRIQFLQDVVTKQGTFIEKKGLMPVYLNEVDVFSQKG